MKAQDDCETAIAQASATWANNGKMPHVLDEFVAYFELLQSRTKKILKVADIYNNSPFWGEGN